MAIQSAARISKAVTTAARTTGLSLLRNPRPSNLFQSSSSQPFRLFHDEDKLKINVPYANPVTLEMIKYAFFLSRSLKTDESYAQGQLVLEQCLSYVEQTDKENSMGIVLLAMSTLLYERGKFDEAIAKLGRIQDFTHASLGVREAAMEALVGLSLELGLDDTSSVLADKCLQLVESDVATAGAKAMKGSVELVDDSDVATARAKAVKGVVELVFGNTEAAESFFQGVRNEECCSGNVALSCGEFLHVNRNFSLAKEFYEKVIQEMYEKKDFSDQYDAAACNMSPEEVLLAATCALGQLEGHIGNFDQAEETLTRALSKAEEQLGSYHPKVGVILVCIALMLRQKGIKERSTSLIIQEGLYRRAIDLLKASSLETPGAEVNALRRDIAALARAGYAELLCVQQNRKVEGEKMKSWAEAAWRNRRLSLAEALEVSEVSSKVAVIDSRISRIL